MIDKQQMIEIKIPASTANLGPGFDSFGLALPLYLTIRMQLAKKNSIKLIGEHLSSLPKDETNLVYKSMRHLFKMEKKELPPISLEIDSEIPLSKGLGSSASAIIGGLLAANQLLDQPKSMDDIYQIAAKLEGHGDNVGASLYGGFVVSVWDGLQAKIAQLPFPDALKIILAIPNYILPTSKARKQIPEKIPLKDASYNIGHASLLVSYLLTGQLDKLPSAMKDRVHQPYRQHAVKGLQRILDQADKMGIFSAALSGAGPAIILFVQEHQIAFTKEAVQAVILDEGLDLQIKTLSFAKEGASVQPNIVQFSK